MTVADTDALAQHELRRVPILDATAATIAARDAATALRPTAAERDLVTAHPLAHVDEVARTGLLAVTLPPEYGGADLPPTTVAEALRLIAAADPNIAEILHGHFVAVNLLRVAGSPEQQRFFFAEVWAGGRLGSAEHDLMAGRLRGARLTRSEPGAFLLNGHKVHCTGAAFATWIATLARLDDGTVEGGEELIAFVPRQGPGVKLIETAGERGQRTTAAGEIEFNEVEVASQHIIRRSKVLDRPRGYGAFSQLLHAAIDVGIARGALEDGAEFVRSAARPHPDSRAQRVQDDPLLIQRFGELTVEVRGAEAALEVAARAVTEVLDHPSEEAAAEALLAVATAKALGERAALAVSSGIFEAGSHDASSQPLNLHRHWRNARTHSAQEPIRWRQHHLGRYTLLGLYPPRHSGL